MPEPEEWTEPHVIDIDPKSFKRYLLCIGDKTYESESPFGPWTEPPALEGNSKDAG